MPSTNCFHPLIEGLAVNITNKRLSDVTISFKAQSRIREGTHFENNIVKILFLINNQLYKQQQSIYRIYFSRKAWIFLQDSFLSRTKASPYIIIKLKEQHPKSMNTFIDIEYNDGENVEYSSTVKSSCLKEEMEIAPIIKLKEEKQKAKKGKRHYKNQYNWNDTENRRYISFLTKKGSLLNLSLGEKKKLRVNVMMSKFIQTRNSTQCHTHHQKMMEKFHSIEAIIQELSSVIKKPKQIVVQEEKIKVEEEPCYFIEQRFEQLEILEIEQVFPRCEPSWKDFLFPQVLQYQQQCQNDLFMF